MSSISPFLILCIGLCPYFVVHLFPSLCTLTGFHCPRSSQFRPRIPEWMAACNWYLGRGYSTGYLRWKKDQVIKVALKFHTILLHSDTTLFSSIWTKKSVRRHTPNDLSTNKSFYGRAKHARKCNHILSFNSEGCFQSAPFHNPWMNGLLLMGSGKETLENVSEIKRP